LAQGINVSVHLALDKPDSHAAPSPAVVWLIPIDTNAKAIPELQPKSFMLLQKGKEFHPHLLVVPVGSRIDFPNQDPFFHNVFSLFEGKRFDLGLYEAGSNRSVRFDREGVSYIFCNIHPEMGAVIISLRTPYYSIVDAGKAADFQNLPEGTYLLKVWAEDVTPESLQAAERKIEIKRGMPPLPTVHLAARENNPTTHKNKFGEDYQPEHPRPY
jgi:plastocyanin